MVADAFDGVELPKKLARLAALLDEWQLTVQFAQQPQPEANPDQGGGTKNDRAEPCRMYNHIRCQKDGMHHDVIPGVGGNPCTEEVHRGYQANIGEVAPLGLDPLVAGPGVDAEACQEADVQHTRKARGRVGVPDVPQGLFQLVSETEGRDERCDDRQCDGCAGNSDPHDGIAVMLESCARSILVLGHEILSLYSLLCQVRPLAENSRRH
jgi:hypothetical protein